MPTHNFCRVPDKCLSSLLSSSGHLERVKSWYFSSSREASTQTCAVKCVGSFISTDRTPLPELIPVTVDHPITAKGKEGKRAKTRMERGRRAKLTGQMQILLYNTKHTHTHTHTCFQNIVSSVSRVFIHTSHTHTHTHVLSLCLSLVCICV